jgi:hypothetical protein
MSFASSIDRVNARVDGIHFVHGGALQDAPSDNVPVPRPFRTFR